MASILFQKLNSVRPVPRSPRDCDYRRDRIAHVARERCPTPHKPTRPMNVEEHEQLRADIWDHIYATGPQSVQQLADQLQLSQQQVVGLVDHAWFSVHEELIGIATDGE